MKKIKQNMIATTAIFLFAGLFFVTIVTPAEANGIIGILGIAQTTDLTNSCNNESNQEPGLSIFIKAADSVEAAVPCWSTVTITEDVNTNSDAALITCMSSHDQLLCWEQKCEENPSSPECTCQDAECIEEWRIDTGIDLLDVISDLPQIQFDVMNDPTTQELILVGLSGTAKFDSPDWLNQLALDENYPIFILPKDNLAIQLIPAQKSNDYELNPYVVKEAETAAIYDLQVDGPANGPANLPDWVVDHLTKYSDGLNATPALTIQFKLVDLDARVFILSAVDEMKEAAE